MMRPMRFAAGTVATLAFLISIAETVVASLCAPMQGMPQIVQVVAEESAEKVPMSANGSDCGDANASDDENAGESPCPFGPYASSQGCSAAASLPANGAEIRSGTRVIRNLTAFRNAGHENLLVVRLFHPPKA